MTAPVINVRTAYGSGNRGGWARLFNDERRMLRTDVVVSRFFQGVSVEALSRAVDLPTLTVESILRWYLQNPKALNEALGRDS